MTPTQKPPTAEEMRAAREALRESTAEMIASQSHGACGSHDSHGRPRLLDRLFSREFVRTNDLGAERRYRIGAVVDGWRVTRYRIVPTTPWATWIVYGRRQRG